MSKITLNPVGSLIDTTTAANTINSNSVTVQTAFDNTLSRDGTSPNQMNASLDMNSHSILNLPSPASQSEPLRVQDATLLNGSGTINLLPVGGSPTQVLTKNSAANYDVSWITQLTQIQTPSFGGRLTLISGQPVMKSDVTAGTHLYLAPYIGKTMPTYTSGVWTGRVFTSGPTDQVGLDLNLAGSANWPQDTIHDVFGIVDTGVLKLATRQWDASMLPTTTLIAPATAITTGTVGSWSNLSNAFNGTVSQSGATCAILTPSNATNTANCIGQDWGFGNTNVISKVILYGPNDDNILGASNPAEGVVIFGSNDNVNYHLMTVVRVNDVGTNNTFTLPMSVTETQSYRYHKIALDGNGASALRVGQLQFYKDNLAATRRLTLQDGTYVNDAIMTARTSASTTVSVAATEGVYLGTVHIDASSPGKLSAITSYGQSRTYGIWNMYNRIRICAQAGSYSPTNFYTPVTTQRWNAIESALTGGTPFSIGVMRGMAEDGVSLSLKRSVYLNAATNPCSYECGITMDTTLNFSGQEGSCNMDATGQAIGFLPEARLYSPPVIPNYNIFYGIERQGNSGTGGQSSFTGPRNTGMYAEWRG